MNQQSLKIHVGADIRKTWMTPKNLFDLQFYLKAVLDLDNCEIEYYANANTLVRIATEQDFQRFWTKNRNSKSLKVQLTVQSKGNNMNPPMQITFNAFDSLSDFQNFKSTPCNPSPSEFPSSLPDLPSDTLDAGELLKDLQDKPKKPAELDTNFTIIHENVNCSECKIQPITGIRFKCIQCENFELCEFCEEIVSHPHALLKLKTPIQCYTNYTKIVSVFNTAEHLPGLKDIIQKKVKEPAKKKFKLKVKQYKFKKQTTLLSGTTSEFAWDIVNKGTKAWPAGSKLVLKKGEFKCEEFVIQEEVLPGGLVVVKSNVTAPEEEKEYAGVWEIDANGKKFGKITAGFKAIFNEKLKEMASVGFGFTKVKYLDNK